MKVHKSLQLIFILITVILLAIFLKVLFFGLYSIQSPSMEDTLLSGDQILVSKLHYGPRLPCPFANRLHMVEI